MVGKKPGPAKEFPERLMVRTTGEQRGALKDYVAKEGVAESEAVREWLEAGGGPITPEAVTAGIEAYRAWQKDPRMKGNSARLDNLAIRLYDAMRRAMQSGKRGKK